MTRRSAVLISVFALSRLFGAAPEPRVVNNFRNLPLAFEKNLGQAAATADFVVRGAGYSVALWRGNAHIVLRSDKSSARAVVELRLLGARPNPPVAGRDALPGNVNYFVGNYPSLGGTYWDDAYGVALDSSGTVFVTGTTQSPDFPTTPGAFQAATGLPRYAAFVTKITQPTPACSDKVSPVYGVLIRRRRSREFQRGLADWVHLDAVAQRLMGYSYKRRRTRCRAAGYQCGAEYRCGAHRHDCGRRCQHRHNPGIGRMYLLALDQHSYLPAGGRIAATVTLEATPNLFTFVRPNLSPLMIDIANTSVAVSQSGASDALPRQH